MKDKLRGVSGPLAKLIAFGLVTILASYVLVSTITNAGYGEQVTYRAEFTDVAGLVEGDEVRISGVRVGQVTGIGLAEGTDRPAAMVDLEVSGDVPLPAGVEATIRYRNLVGQRYIALTDSDGSAGRPSTRARSSRWRRRRRPSTSPSSSAASSRCCRRCRRPT
ncbi:MlaD family protein [Blastococcus brunescens]|uniref:MlaD family protein n=1 Tax=Blastococcus brunescens TaxID=1564165 RepID=A0ABZ1AX05_9ACTN|nr:MlaD family protein [Blastococcus sp. BMG 8361]WRL63103.1 MlaD family protein [Blastococcus sp. BMG 8361]